MERERYLKRKASPVKPDKRLIATHPFFVWSALRRFEVMDKLAGDDHRFRCPEEIASVLFSNWSELDSHQQARVVRYKLELPLRFLRSERSFVSEETKDVTNPCPWEADYKPILRMGLNRWRAIPGPWFGSSSGGFSDEECLKFTYYHLDDEWGNWTGRNHRRDALRERILRETSV